MKAQFPCCLIKFVHGRTYVDFFFRADFIGIFIGCSNDSKAIKQNG